VLSLLLHPGTLLGLEIRGGPDGKTETSILSHKFSDGDHAKGA
jgi:hypothetical protein